MRGMIGALLIGVSLIAGAELSTMRAASLMPVRDAGGCAALDQDVSGRLIGHWQPRNGRCELRDWRIWHPFGG